MFWLGSDIGRERYVREPFAITARGLVWIVTTVAGMRVLEFPPLQRSSLDSVDTAELRVWEALEAVRDPALARVELDPRGEWAVPFVALSIPSSDFQSEFALHSSALLVSCSAVTGVLGRVGLRVEDIPSAMVVTGLDGSEVLVCSACRLIDTRAWIPLTHLLNGGALNGGAGSDSLRLPPPAPF